MKKMTVVNCSEDKPLLMMIQLWMMMRYAHHFGVCPFGNRTIAHCIKSEMECVRCRMAGKKNMYVRCCFLLFPQRRIYFALAESRFRFWPRCSQLLQVHTTTVPLIDHKKKKKLNVYLSPMPIRIRCYARFFVNLATAKHRLNEMEKWTKLFAFTSRFFFLFVLYLLCMNFIWYVNVFPFDCRMNQWRFHWIPDLTHVQVPLSAASEHISINRN